MFSNSKRFDCYLKKIGGGSGVYNASFFLLKTCRLVIGKISCWMVCELAPVHMNTQNVDWHINASVWAAGTSIHSLAWDALQNERQDPQNTNNPIHPYVPFNISRLKRRSLSRMWKKSRRSHESQSIGSASSQGFVMMKRFVEDECVFAGSEEVRWRSVSGWHRFIRSWASQWCCRCSCARSIRTSGVGDEQCACTWLSVIAPATSELFGGVPSEPKSTEPSPVRSCRRVAQ